MLAGRWAAPLPCPRNGAPTFLLNPPGGRTVVVELAAGITDLRQLSAGLAATGRPPVWVRPAPYDLDPSALEAMTAAALRVQPDVIRRSVVIESAAPGQADAVHHALTRIAGTPWATVLLREGRRPRAQLRPAPVLRQPERDWPALHAAALSAAARLGTGRAWRALEESRDAGELTYRLTGLLLADVAPRTLAALHLAALLDYCHPRYPALAAALEPGGDLPWWVPLTDGWQRVEPVWRSALLAVSAAAGPPPSTLVGRVAAELAEDGAPGVAVQLCLDAGYAGMAADLLTSLGPALAAAGRTLAVRAWLRRLPLFARRRYRQLAMPVRVVGPARRNGSREPTALAPATASTSEHDPQDDSCATMPEGAVARVTVARQAVLEARLLGTIGVTLDGRGVERWHGRRAPALLAFLLLHRGQRVTRETLVSTFWPDASAAQARNRLHVTLHGLRADLAAASPAAVVVFRCGCYGLDGALRIRLDVDEFDRATEAGAEADRRGDPRAALAAHGRAVREYRGDLMSDYHEDEWLLLPREQYRLRRLESLGRCAQLSFDLGAYDEAVRAGAELLTLDFCREDVHRLLMRAYVRLGRPQQARRQFDVCASELRRELGVEPAHETLDLLDRVRSGAPL